MAVSILSGLLLILVDVLKDIIIYKNTQDVSILFVLTQQDVDNLVTVYLVEEAFEIIDYIN